jgi:hypothetical protein
MSDFSLDALPYFKLLHSIVRQDSLDEDEDRIAECVAYAKQHASILRKVLTKDEFGIIKLHLAYWDKHRVAPSRNDLKELVSEQKKNQGMTDTLFEYDRYRPDLEELPPEGLNIYLDQRKADY